MRRLASEIFVALALIACGDPAPVDAGLDGGLGDAGFDAALATCGNARVEPMERCDDGNLEPGDGCDAECHPEPFCGDGVPDPGEVCDDGNGSFGDGCTPDCASDETCGNGILDAARGEVCDSAPGCTEGCAWSACGDGALDPGETCDDGGAEPFDGCGADCRPEITFSATEFEIAPADRGCDLSGDGLVDNRFAQSLRSARVPVGTFINETLLQDLFLLVSLHGVDDLAAADDERVVVSVAHGWDGNASLDDNENEGNPVYALTDWIPAPGRPEHALVGSITDRVLEAGPGSLFLRTRSGPAQVSPCDLSVRTIDFVLHRARLRGQVRGEIDGPAFLDDVTICGALPARAFAAEENVIAGFLTFRPCDGRSEVTLADLILGGADLAGVPIAPVQPDVDLDGDGLERFLMNASGPAGCQPVVEACIDGDGTRFDGHGCIYEPAMADAFSMALELRGVRASLVGLIDDEEACALGR